MDTFDQISLFHIEACAESENNGTEMLSTAEVVPFDIEDRVRVVSDLKESDDLEAYFYIKEFVGKRGIVKEVVTKPNLQYSVIFNNQIAIVYHSELLHGWP